MGFIHQLSSRAIVSIGKGMYIHYDNAYVCQYSKKVNNNAL